MKSFKRLHEIAGRATPEKLMQHKLALSLYKLYSGEQNSLEFIALNFTQILTSRQITFMALNNNKLKVGLNALSNRFKILNNKIPLTWLNLSLDTYKIKCKLLFL